VAPAFITLDSVSFAYATKPVLQDISMSVATGSTLGVIGPNGGGKTTLIKLLLGQLSPSSGTITIAGLTPRQAVDQGNILGYVPQTSPATAPALSRLPLTVREMVRLGLAGKTGILRPYQKTDLTFLDSLLERVGLASCSSTLVRELSGGLYQRALIARALVSQPKLLLLDEPTTGIDRAGQQLFIEFILSLKADFNLTLLLVSHDLRAVASVADRIACLNTTLHYHDVPQHLPPDLVYRLFACDLEAMGLDGKHTPGHPSLPAEAQVPLTIHGR
jgi:zinc transport system ATP-binding protein